MRRLLLALVLVLLAASAGAQMRVSDLVLTDEGTLFTVDVIQPSEYEKTSGTTLDTMSSSVLRLRIQHEDTVDSLIVPGSLEGGDHVEPSLAFDETEGRLYIFWQRMPGLGSSELLFASYKDGAWSEVAVFDSGIWRIRFNLKVSITRYAERRFLNGKTTRVPTLIAHAIWWEQLGQRESARYAMLELEQGAVRSVQIHELTDFVTQSDAQPFVLDEEFDRSVFRTPFLFEAPDGDSIDVMFANWYTNRYQLVTIKPVEDEKNGVLHIPIGVTAGEFPPAPIRNRDTNAELQAMRPSPYIGAIVVYSNDGTRIDYTELRNGLWSASKVLKLSPELTLDTALEGFRRRLSRR